MSTNPKARARSICSFPNHGSYRTIRDRSQCRRKDLTPRRRLPCASRRAGKLIRRIGNHRASSWPKRIGFSTVFIHLARQAPSGPRDGGSAQSRVKKDRNVGRLASRPAAAGSHLPTGTHPRFGQLRVKTQPPSGVAARKNARPFANHPRTHLSSLP